MTAIDNLNAICDNVKAGFIARDEMVDVAKLSIIAQHHMLVIGPPGTAKSAVFGDLVSQLDGKHGYWQLHKGSVPESLVGTMDIDAYKNRNEFRYETEGMLPDVEYAIIDEVFKSNKMVRDALLQIINERKFKNGRNTVSVPLRTAFAASNEFDEDPDSAFSDRFLAVMQVGYIEDPGSRMEMVKKARLRGRRFADGTPAITLADLDELYQRSRQVAIPEEVEETADALYNALVDVRGANVGDRRWAQSFDLAAAMAVSKGRDKMASEDLGVFAHTCWKTPQARAEISKLVAKMVAPALSDAIESLDAVEDGYKRLSETMQKTKDPMDRMTAIRQFMITATNAKEELEETIIKMEAKGQDTSRARDIHSQIYDRVRSAGEFVYDKTMKGGF